MVRVWVREHSKGKFIRFPGWTCLFLKLKHFWIFGGAETDVSYALK